MGLCGYGNPHFVMYAYEKPDGYAPNDNDCDDAEFYVNSGILDIRNMVGVPVGEVGVPMDDFETGLNYVTMDPACFQYDSYTLLQDSRDQGKLLTIHRLPQASELISSTYWFFGAPCGENFIILNGVPYWVFGWE